MMPAEQIAFKEGGVTVTLKVQTGPDEVRCTLLLDITEDGVLGDPYEFVPPCTMGGGTSAGAAINDAARGLPDAAKVLIAMGEREAGLNALAICHQIAEYAATRLGVRRTSPA